MLIVKSKYDQVMRGIALLVILFGVISVIYALIGVTSSSKEFLNNSEALYISLVIVPINIFLLYGFINRCKIIRVYDSKLTFTNPILPFLITKIEWSQIDYCFFAEDQWKYSTYESIYFVKNKKVKYNISSQFYRNYKELKEEIHCKSKGKVKPLNFNNFLIKRRLKKITPQNIIFDN